MGRTAAAWLLILLGAGCQPLYLPPVPAPLELPARFELTGSSALLQEGRPALRLLLGRVPQEGWLAVQWFAPDNREAASESVWVAPGMEGTVVHVTLPPDIESTDGRWRAVLSLEGEVVRQLSVEVPDAPTEETVEAE